MDHIPRPRKPLLDPIKVPYRCTEAYDGAPMLTYPERHDWQVSYHPGGISYLLKGEKPSDKELEAFLQNWLYFGLLSEVFGSFLDDSDFITRTENGEKIVTTQHLEKYCQSWRVQLQDSFQKSIPGEPQAGEHAMKSVSHVWKVALNSKSRLRNNEIDPRIWFSLIYDVVYEHNGSIDTYTNTWRTPSNPPIGEFILEEMREKGWCPFDISIIDLTTKSGSLLYYFANLPPPRPHANHSKCTSEICTSMTIDSSYQTSHGAADCHCQEEFGDVETVKAVLGGDEIPLIERIFNLPSRSENPSTQFRIIEGSTNTEFVAISHVWAEGLGNYAGNTLPTCSIKRISDLVDQSLASDGKSMPFWLDTLCVPTEPDDMRLRALNRLRKPYQDAKHVLVLDSYLYNHDSASASALEAWARVLVCSWSRRLWTFQEGRLAKNLWYQFADRALKMEEIFVAMKFNVSTKTLQNEIMIAYHGSNIIRNLGDAVTEQVRANFRPEPDVWDMRESLKARAVSVKSDEALCLFCNMNLDMELVTSLPLEQRMPKFWSEVKKIPVGLVFSRSENKLAEWGLRWAPQSFIGELDIPYWYLEQCIYPRVNAHPTPDGLHAQLPSILFFSGLLVEDSSFDTLFTDNWLNLQDADGTWYFVDTGGYWNQSRKDDPKEGGLLAMLLVKPVSSVDEEIPENEFDFFPGIQGVIGTVWDDGGDVPRFEGFRHAMLHRYSVAFSRFMSAVAACVEIFVEKEYNLEYKKGGGDEGENEEEDDREEVVETDEAGKDVNDRIGTDVNEVQTTNAESSEGEEPEEGDEYEAPNDGEESDDETPDTFILTTNRRERCQAFAKLYAGEDTEANEICLKVGQNMGRGEEESYDHFGKMARFQLQMRLRNRIEIGDQTQAFIID